MILIISLLIFISHYFLNMIQFIAITILNVITHTKLDFG